MKLTDKEIEILIDALIDIDNQWGLDKREKALLRKLQREVKTKC